MEYQNHPQTDWLSHVSPMKPIDPTNLNLLWYDLDCREDRLREIVRDRLAETPPPLLDDQIVATYFFAFRTQTLAEAAKEISYHATSGTRHPLQGSLIEQCTGRAVGMDAFDATGRLGILHMAYPLKMLLQTDGHLTSCDILHTVAGAILFDVYENQDARLLALTMPERVVRSFPGPAYGPRGLREGTGFAANEPAFGTILKPTAGITPKEVGALVEEVASCPLFLFVKEDENLYPNLDYSPVRERARQAAAAIERAKGSRRGKGLIFAPHISGSPHEILDTVHAVLEAGATGVMFSESFAGGTVRMAREATKALPRPPAIYGHNAGIGVKTRCIRREVIDLLARLDGIDFRQTAPVRAGTPFLRPYGLEWEASEDVLTRPLPGIKPVMIARAGGLDQGNICMNLAEVEMRGISENVLFLAGSAINSIKNVQGKYDSRLGAEAMQQALEAYRAGAIRNLPLDKQAAALLSLAQEKGWNALASALRQRYSFLTP
jgi:ribulose 1,5-bisphosphate carboxylase large subunit-like protein